jgi:hypothetical protein
MEGPTPNSNFLSNVHPICPPLRLSDGQNTLAVGHVAATGDEGC